jgi:hypothetical protein
LYKQSSSFQKIASQLQQQNAELYTDDRLTSVLAMLRPLVVPQYARQKYVDWDKGDRGPSSVREMLPKAFANISLRTDPGEASFTGGTRQLTEHELGAITRIVQENPYAAREFERAGLLMRHNGSAYINTHATQEHVNALGGMIANMFAIGMKGAPSSHVDDIESPAAFDKLKYRDNLYVSHARQIASELSEAFEWLQPAHIAPALKPADAAWKPLDRYRVQPRQTTMEFVEFDPAQVKGDAVEVPSADGVVGRHR